MKLIKIKIYCSCTSKYNIIKQTSLINLKSTYHAKQKNFTKKNAMYNIYRTEIETLTSCKNIL